MQFSKAAPTRKILHFRFQSYEKLIDFATKKVFLGACQIPGAEVVVKPTALPTKIKRWTVLASPFIDKRAREVWERRTFYRYMAVEMDRTKTRSFIDWVLDELPAGVNFRVQQHAFERLEENYERLK